MQASDLRLGPVLSLRGVDRVDGRSWWRVSAMVGLPRDAGQPALEVDGRAVAAPVLLLAHGDLQVLRYDLSTTLTAQEQRVTYGFAAAGVSWSFTVPADDLALRLACVSCNGFSEAKKMRQYAGRASSVWSDLVDRHEGAGRFHALLMGGDQVYMDSMWEELEELKAWAELSHVEQRGYPVSPAARARIEDHYVSTYLDRWLPSRRGAWNEARAGFDAADAMARIPTLMMWDDHDIFDGWGSYSAAMQAAPLPQALFACARKAFWVFQMQHPAPLLPDNALQPVTWSALRTQDPLLLPLLDDQPGFSCAMPLGPLALVLADLRTERTRDQVLGEGTWRAIQRWVGDIPAAGPAAGAATPRHLLFASSVPVTFPSVTAVDDLHDIFGSEHVTESNADDLRDHWSHSDHAAERARLAQLLVDTARDKRIRVSIVSGDVHAAAWGSIFAKDAASPLDWPAVHELISSGIVHPPTTGPVQWIYMKLLQRAARAVQPIGPGHAARMHPLAGSEVELVEARNWLALELRASAQLHARWRCEQGDGFVDHALEIEPAPAP
ncbi:MAG TPA: alkaline phosphatase family protein [Ramlibacter sp.]|jgi:hypothetical protein|nr:alkaline phosphatase family protein [Ramlibacter sp.]